MYEPLKLRAVHEILITEDLIDSSVRSALPMQIADGFEAARDKYNEGSPTDAEVRALFESALLLTRLDFRKLAGPAQGMLMQLYAEKPGFEWRLKPETEDVPAEE